MREGKSFGRLNDDSENANPGGVRVLSPNGGFGRPFLNS
jgi:hypothetical protein